MALTRNGDKMSAIVMRPHSQTNPSDKFRVTHYQDWIHFINGATTSYGYVAFDTYEEAEKARDTINQLENK